MQKHEYNKILFDKYAYSEYNGSNTLEQGRQKTEKAEEFFKKGLFGTSCDRIIISYGEVILEKAQLFTSRDGPRLTTLLSTWRYHRGSGTLGSRGLENKTNEKKAT